ncbi:RNaseH domain-containing protein [Streptomyces milbemycinicus]
MSPTSTPSATKATRRQRQCRLPKPHSLPRAPSYRIQAPAVIYVNGDTTEYIWAGLREENFGQQPPADLPRPASWLPGHGLPRSQRPLAIVRTIKRPRTHRTADRRVRLGEGRTMGQDQDHRKSVSACVG